MMPKKTFETAPRPKQPTADQIEAFERGGAGHDADVALEEKQQRIVKTAPEPTKRLSLDLPVTVHTRFKTACSATSRKMVTEIQQFIEKRTKELESEAGITHK